jgi:hypothetical protein
MERGQSGGFRVMMLWNEAENTLCPFCIYTHVAYPKQPPTKDLRQWLKEAIAVPSPPKVMTVGSVVVKVCFICGSFLSDDEKDAFGDRCAVHRTS